MIVWDEKNANLFSVDDTNLPMIKSSEIPDWVILRFLDGVPSNEITH
jgi:hypothetical protein